MKELYFITNSDNINEEAFLKKIEDACKNSISLLQLREKEKSTKEYYELGLKVKQITDRYQVPLIIDDRIDIAMALHCGVHLGKEDMPIDIARKLLGNQAIIGATAKTVEDALKVEAQGANYIGCGAIYPTKTHVKTKITNVETLNEIRGNVKIPVYAIGGLNANNLDILKGSHIQGICVVSAIMDAQDTSKTVKELIQKVNQLC